MKTRRIGTFDVPAIGLGCMNLSHAYGVPPSPAAGAQVLLQALDHGVTLFDTAALYGHGANETLVGQVLKAHRSKIVLCTKGGMAGVQTAQGLKRVIDGRPDTIRRNCEDSLRRLQTDCIDLYYLHRWDKNVPIEDSVGACARLLREGKIRAIGLSEVSASTLRRAQQVHPIAAVQTEYSLWTRNPEIAVLEACRKSGTAFVAFSPLGRGLLTDAPPQMAALPANDIRHAMPRFDSQHYPHNLRLQSALASLAQEAGCSTAQLALAWVLARGEHVLAIPGTARVEHMLGNVQAAALELPAAVLQRASAILNEDTVRGARYNAATTAEVDTETF
jgi:aryl-alcohol dehydrogenase-like predicted oxidoreductase